MSDKITRRGFVKGAALAGAATATAALAGCGGGKQQGHEQGTQQGRQAVGQWIPSHRHLPHAA